MKRIIQIVMLLYIGSPGFGQHLGAPIRDAEKQGIRIAQLDKIYKSAVHSDTSMAVFKTDSAQAALLMAYTGLLQDLGRFLTKNNFHWDRPVKSWNRIYFSAEGTIDYFLYVFHEQSLRPEDRLSSEKKNEFNRLLNQFILGYTFPLNVGVKFAQCSPVTYMPQAD